MNVEQLVETIVAKLGGTHNIAFVTNCMTRLRVTVRSEADVDEEGLKGVASVMGVVHDRPAYYEVVVGPGTSKKCADLCHEMGLATTAAAGGDWKANKAAHAQAQGGNRLRASLKVLADVFVPLIPGVIVAGLCAGFASLLTQLVPNYADVLAWSLLYKMLLLINVSFMTYITAWAGYRAAEHFGGTPILGGMLGMITTLSGINEIAQALGLYDKDTPLNSVLLAGKGGVLAVIFGVFIMCSIEKRLRKKMPANLDIVFTPLLTMLICMVPYVLVIMPVFGYVSSGIAWAMGEVCLSDNVWVRAVTGFIAAAVFLPLVACGMHYGIIALYTVQLQQLGHVTLYPALAMAGAGQIGAALAIYLKARKLKHKKLCSVIEGALPAGFLGVGEPLIYGVTLPMGKPFLTAGLGAGFGGAFVMVCQVSSTTWGPSDLLGCFVMTAGQGGPLMSVAMYLVGLLISYVAAFIITNVAIRNADVAQALGGMESEGGEGKATETLAASKRGAGEAAGKRGAGGRGGEAAAEGDAGEAAGEKVAGEMAAARFAGETSVEGGANETAGEKVASWTAAMHGSGKVTAEGSAGETVAARTVGKTAAAPACAPATGGARTRGQRRRVRHGEAVGLPVTCGEAGRAVACGEAERAVTFEHVIRDPKGIHARPAGELARVASGFQADITVEHAGRAASARSVVELMLLEATQGSALTVRATGHNAPQAADALRRFMAEKL